MKQLSCRTIVSVMVLTGLVLSLSFLHMRPSLAQSDSQGRTFPGYWAGYRKVVIQGAGPSTAKVPPPSNAALGKQTATFNVQFNPPTCQGAVVPWPVEAQAAFNFAVNIWGAALNSTQTIQVHACYSSQGGGILGSAGPASFHADFLNAPTPNTTYPAALANALANSDLNDNDGDDSDGDGNDADVEIISDFNSDITYYFGTDMQPGPGDIDFVTLILHELGHGLGFLDTMNVEAGQGSWSDPPSAYDRFIQNGNGQTLIDAFGNFSAELAAQLQSNDLLFGGPNATAANNGTAPKLYAPNPYESGSSIGHLDEDTYPPGDPNTLMSPVQDNGEVTHSPGSITLGIFRDIGWNTGSTELPEKVYLPLVIR